MKKQWFAIYTDGNGCSRPVLNGDTITDHAGNKFTFIDFTAPANGKPGTFTVKAGSEYITTTGPAFSIKFEWEEEP